MKREPIYYDENNDRVRYVSKPNGMWMRQELGDGKGTKTFDPWKDIGLPFERKSS